MNVSPGSRTRAKNFGCVAMGSAVVGKRTPHCGTTVLN